MDETARFAYQEAVLAREEIADHGRQRLGAIGVDRMRRVIDEDDVTMGQDLPKEMRAFGRRHPIGSAEQGQHGMGQLGEPRFERRVAPRPEQAAGQRGMFRDELARWGRGFRLPLGVRVEQLCRFLGCDMSRHRPLLFTDRGEIKTMDSTASGRSIAIHNATFEPKDVPMML